MKQELYQDLGHLLHRNQRAKEYYLSLPDYVQGHLQQEFHFINSLDTLTDYAEALLRSGGFY